MAGAPWWQPVVVSQELGTFTCTYVQASRSVVFDVPVRVATRGSVDWMIQAQLHDLRDPDRQPYVTTRRLTFDTHGKVEERTEQLTIPVQRAEWAAGHRDCRVTHAVE